MTTTPTRGLCCNADEVRTLLAGGEVVKWVRMRNQPSEGWMPHSYGEVHKMVNGEPDLDKVIGWGPCNYFGDEAYVCPRPVGTRCLARESWCHKMDPITAKPVYNEAGDFDQSCLWYEASNPEIEAFDDDGCLKFNKNGMQSSPWISPALMPLRYSRLTTEVIAVTAEQRGGAWGWREVHRRAEQ